MYNASNHKRTFQQPLYFVIAEKSLKISYLRCFFLESPTDFNSVDSINHVVKDSRQSQEAEVRLDLVNGIIDQFDDHSIYYGV